MFFYKLTITFLQTHLYKLVFYKLTIYPSELIQESPTGTNPVVFESIIHSAINHSTMQTRGSGGLSGLDGLDPVDYQNKQKRKFKPFGLSESENIIIRGICCVCTLALTVAKSRSHYDRFVISVPAGSLLMFELAFEDGNISGPKGSRGTRGIGDISEARFVTFITSQLLTI